MWVLMSKLLMSWVRFKHFWGKIGVVQKDLPRKGKQWCCSGIVSSWDTCPKVIRWLRSSRMNRDCIILELLFITDPVNSVLENVVGLYHLWTSVQNRFGDFGPQEWRGIVSSLDICPERIQWLQSSRMWRDCIILGHLSIIDPVASVLENVVGLHHPWT